jgi:hypothetical protein
MRTITLLMSVALGSGACGGGPALGGVPHPNNAAMAGGVAAAAAALTLADPHAADRKPEQRVEDEKQPVDVKEQVPASAFDHLDSGGNGSGHEVVRPHAGDAAKTAPASDATSGADAGTAAPTTATPVAPADRAKPAPAAKPATPAKPATLAKPTKPTKPNGKLPTLPTPHDAVDPDHADSR